MNNNAKLLQIVNYTQEKVNGWYENAKIDYGVVGSATVAVFEDEVSITRVEDGEVSSFSISIPELLDEHVDYLYNVWCEQA